MKTDTTRRAMLAGGLAAPAVLGAGSVALAAEPEWQWKMQSLWPAGTPYFDVFNRFADSVKAVTGGRLEIETLPVGAVVAYNETVDAVAAGILDAHYSAPVYASGREPALGLLGDLNGGFSNPYEVQMWMEYGGGRDLAEEIYAGLGLTFVGSVSYTVESIPSTKPVRTLADLEGLKMRSPEGVAGAIWRRFGVGVVTLGGSEIYTALDSGAIDATDWTSLSQNMAQGFFDMCDYALYPGFHSCAALDISVNPDRWNELPEAVQHTLRMAVRDFSRDATQTNAIQDAEAAGILAAEGVELIDFSAADRLEFRKVAQEEWHKWAEKSPMAATVLASQEDFLKKINLL